ncbi:SDR family NAD(P)-dependent oxidoreductase [Sandaracinobacteroides saxicola]|uniref:SDR family NAD(P)-dependent oxidoreductase n=2 Tax=Sandaracinobacteroides saxicola TaxID=2759707 RepID=A0A7G5IMW6_9SPHN|nr:SDR family NAD(P)-dependent oxidoreductase [Sandaracinobacteroides saxicola]
MDPLFDFTGQVVLITGGSRGLGAAMARAFAERGADLIIASRKLDACETLAAELRTNSRRALAVAAHCGRWADIDALVETAYAEFGRVDILVNNAGMSPACPSHQVSEALFDSILNLNFKGPFRLASQIAHRMSTGNDKAGGGAILNISSVAATQAIPGVVPYGGAKAALESMTRGLAREYAPKVRVNAIAAGPFLTDIAQAWTPEARQHQPVALARPGLPHEIITAALTLTSPASTYTTGALLRVDGGPR